MRAVFGSAHIERFDRFDASRPYKCLWNDADSSRILTGKEIQPCTGRTFAASAANASPARDGACGQTDASALRALAAFVEGRSPRRFCSRLRSQARASSSVER